MRHKIFCKKFKSSLILTTIAAIILSVVLSSATMIHQAFADSYVESHSSEARNLAITRLYYEAAKKCVAHMNSTQVELSSQRGDATKAAMRAFYNLSGDAETLFGRETIYNEILARNAGKDNGQFWCSELNTLEKLLSRIGANTDVKNQLICNGASSGIFEIKTGYGGQMFGAQYDNDRDGQNDWPSGWSSNQTDCASNLENLKRYIDGDQSAYTIQGSGNGNHDYSFRVKISPSSNATAWLESVLGPLIGNFDSVSSETQSAMKYWIYHDTFNAGCAQINNGNTTPPQSSGDTYYAIYDLETNQTYYHNQNQIHGDNDKFIGTTNGEKYKCRDLAQLLNRDSVESQAATTQAQTTGDPTGGTQDPTQQQQPDGAVTCSDSAHGLSWIVCTVVTGASELLGDLYQKYVEPMLVVDTDLVKQDSNTYEAWKTFRDIANVLFVIYLLFVIFSQVSGFGIDNYGIKKSLPRLIVAAVVVNLSFIICQGAVDLSNIVGNSAAGLLSRLGGDLPSSIGDLSTGASASAVGVLVLAVGGGAIWAFANAGGFAAAALMILGVVIGALIALVFMFFLLAGRQAVVVILIVVSPLAFVCYSLPNTKKIFDRWFAVVKGMLLLYPICGLVIGGGSLVSKIILKAAAEASGVIISNPGDILTQFGALSDGSQFVLLITAVIAEVGPYFLIPSLVRSAYNATGQLGASLNKLRGRVGGLSGTARRSISNTRAYKRHQQNLDIKREGARAKRVIGRYGNRDANKLSDAQRRRLIGAYQVTNSQRQEENKLTAEKLKYDTFNPAAVQEGLKSQAEKDLVADQETLIKSGKALGLNGEAMDTRGGENLEALFLGSNSVYARAKRDYREATTDEGRKAAMIRMKAVANIAGNRKDTAKAFLEQVKSDRYESPENQQMLRDLSKALVTSQGAKNYRAADAAGFEWISDTNRSPANAQNFGSWATETTTDEHGNTVNLGQQRIDNAIERHVTNASEMYGQSNSSLNYLSAHASAKGQAQLQRIAADAKAVAKQSGTHDATKDEVIDRLARTSAPVRTPSSGNYREPDSQRINIDHINPRRGNVPPEAPHMGDDGGV